MNMMTKKDRFIRTAKQMASIVPFMASILFMLLIFILPDVAAQVLFSRNVIGLVGLVAGLGIGFARGTNVTREHYERKMAKLEAENRKLNNKIRRLSYSLSAARGYIHKNIKPSEKQTQAPSTSETVDSRTDNMFNLLNDLNDEEFPSEEEFDESDSFDSEALSDEDLQEEVAS